MNRFRFFLAFNVFLAIAFFVYFGFPEEWRKKPLLNILLIIHHAIGIVSLELTFMVYRDIPYAWLKTTATVISTYYYISMMITATFFGIRLLINLFRHPYLRKHPEKKRWIRLNRAHQSVIVLLSSYVLVTVGFINMNHLHTTSYETVIDKKGMPEDLNVVFLSDTHAGAGNWDSLYTQLEEQLTAADPDLLIIGGDVFDETTCEEDIEKLTDVIASIHPTYGIYYVLGNHDDPEDEDALEAMAAAGAILCSDEKIVIEDTIQILFRSDDGMEERPSVEELFEQCDVDQELPVVVVQHRPTQLRDLAEHGADLVLAGHTHGVNIPMYLTVCHQADLVYGMKRFDSMTAIVTSGVSGWGFHYKFPAINELVSLRIQFE